MVASRPDVVPLAVGNRAEHVQTVYSVTTAHMAMSMAIGIVRSPEMTLTCGEMKVLIDSTIVR
jgi:hypothetical protein